MDATTIVIVTYAYTFLIAKSISNIQIGYGCVIITGLGFLYVQ